MLSISKSGEVFTKFGTNSTVLSFLGNGVDWHFLMSQLSKPIREHWFEWMSEYKEMFHKNKLKVNIQNFDAKTTEILINCFQYFKFILFTIFISNKEELEEFYNFLSQWENLEDLEIGLFKISYDFKLYEDEEAFHKLQNTLSQSVFSFRTFGWKDPDDLEKWVDEEPCPIKYVSSIDLNKHKNLLKNEWFVSNLRIDLEEDQSLDNLKECKFSSYSWFIRLRASYSSHDKTFFSESLMKSLKVLYLSYVLDKENSVLL